MWKCTIRYGDGISLIFRAPDVTVARREAFQFLNARGVDTAFSVCVVRDEVI